MALGELVIVGGMALLGWHFVEPAGASVTGVAVSRPAVLEIVTRVNAEMGGRFNPADIMALIRIESNFQPDALGKAGEIGLMQIMPATAWDRGYDPATLTDAETNIRCGMAQLAWVWDYLTRRLGRPPSLSEWLTGYNAGVGNVMNGFRSSAYVAKFEVARAGLA